MNNFNQIFIHNQPCYQKKINKEYSRIITAAVINKPFRKLLLANPMKAISAGFCSETFNLSNEELAQIKSIRAKSLEEFASKLSRIEESIYVSIPLPAGD